MNRPLYEITNQAYELLFRELGPIDTIRFLNQFHLGSGNYTEDRRAWADKLTHDEIFEAIKKQRSTERPT